MVREILALAFLFPFCSLAEEINIPGTSIYFDAPDGFGALSKEMVDVKFPSRNGPRFVIGNERGTTTIAFDVKNISITEDALESQIEGIGEAIGRGVPGHISIAREIRSIGGRKWAYFEMASTAVDADIHNIVLMGVDDGRLVIMNFNSTKSDFSAVEPVLRASVNSLRVRE